MKSDGESTGSAIRPPDRVPTVATPAGRPILAIGARTHARTRRDLLERTPPCRSIRSIAPPPRRRLAAELVLAHVEKAAAAATSPAALHALLDASDYPDDAVESVAHRAKVVDARLLDRLLRTSENGLVLARNRRLDGRHLQRLVLWALHRTSFRADLPAVGAPGVREPCAEGRPNPEYDRECYATLQVLAEQGRLDRFPFAQRLLLRRIVGPIFHPVMTVITDVMLAVRVMLACPAPRPDILAAFDARLARVHPNHEGSRVQLVRHPAASVELWRTMLRHGVSDGVARAIRAAPGALDDAEVRYRLAERDG